MPDLILNPFVLKEIKMRFGITLIHGTTMEINILDFVPNILDGLMPRRSLIGG